LIYFYYLIRFLIFLWGVIVYITGDKTLYGVNLSSEQGLIFCIAGIFFFWSNYLTDKLNKQKKESFVICNSCKKVYDKKYVEILRCPICNGHLIDYHQDGNKRTTGNSRDTRQK